MSKSQKSAGSGGTGQALLPVTEGEEQRREQLAGDDISTEEHKSKSDTPCICILFNKLINGCLANFPA